MPKKAVTKKKTSTKKKATKKKTTTTKKTSTKLPKEATVEKVLVENFTSLQKVMTNLATEFNDLSAQISKLLELFEISAKTLAEKDIKINATPSEDKKVAEKLDSLIDQNKIIARGLTLLHETPGEPMQPMNPPIPQAMPPPQMQKPLPPQQRIPDQLPPLNPDTNTGEYQKSQKPSHYKSPRLSKKNETVF